MYALGRQEEAALRINNFCSHAFCFVLFLFSHFFFKNVMLGLILQGGDHLV